MAHAAEACPLPSPADACKACADAKPPRRQPTATAAPLGKSPLWCPQPHAPLRPTCPSQRPAQAPASVRGPLLSSRSSAVIPSTQFRDLPRAKPPPLRGSVCTCRSPMCRAQAYSAAGTHLHFSPETSECLSPKLSAAPSPSQVHSSPSPNGANLRMPTRAEPETAVRPEASAPQVPARYALKPRSAAVRFSPRAG